MENLNFEPTRDWLVVPKPDKTPKPQNPLNFATGLVKRINQSKNAQYSTLALVIKSKWRRKGRYGAHVALQMVHRVR